MFYDTNYGVSLIKALHNVKYQFYTFTLGLKSISEFDILLKILYPWR